MPITHLYAENIKCFEKLDITFDPLTVIVGANASGKSGFINVLGFLRDIIRLGLSDAVAVQGGGKYLVNLRTGSPIISMSVSYSRIGLQDVSFLYPNGRWGMISVTDVTVNFSLDFSNPKLKIMKDEILLTSIMKDPDGVVEKGVWKVERTGDDTQARSFTREDGTVSDSSVLPIFLTDSPLISDRLLIEFPGIMFSWSLNEYLRHIIITDINPHSVKLGLKFNADSALLEDGSNMASVLHRLLQDPNDREKFLGIVKEFLPFIEDVSVPDIAGVSSYVAITEKCDVNTAVPAHLVSDGTLTVIAHILMIAFSGEDFLILEEPEKAIHPQLMKKLAGLLVETAKNKQIVVTTHNPELIRQLPPDSLLLLSRQKNGCSIMSKPIERRNVVEFLKNEIGIEELYTQGLL